MPPYISCKHAYQERKGSHGRQAEDAHHGLKEKIQVTQPSGPCKEGSEKRDGNEDLHDPEETVQSFAKARLQAFFDSTPIQFHDFSITISLIRSAQGGGISSQNAFPRNVRGVPARSLSF